ncbi:helix-turn-helix domain-containing protein [Streptomyces montanisoli]|uniref:Helix-turn-helix transcriptional regulator n=1 Tax=Streptomyces montanisoli TaxID=2798581 RepID=A0A940RY61_9ACTN|nr:helix-turn-helix transcriptional regulator [Streptomyces montanisoli]MBP0458843.1 helix-turn-helix transcriptional regulator [Streptomyces montanisoli]
MGLVNDDGLPDGTASDSLRTFGAVLKALREQARLTQEQFAPKVGYSAAYIAKIEQGKRFPPRDLVERTESVLGEAASRVVGAAARSLTRKVGLASWFRQWAAVEEEALALYAYECAVVPGLLQPELYIREVCERHLPPLSEEQLERQVAARLLRQQLIGERPHVMFCFILEEALLRRHLGGAAVTSALLDRLIYVSGLRNVELLIMPLRQECHSGHEGAMYLAETPDRRLIGYIEAHDTSLLVTDRDAASAMQHRYGRMRSEALSRQESRSLLEQMRGEL